MFDGLRFSVRNSIPEFSDLFPIDKYDDLQGDYTYEQIITLLKALKFSTDHNYKIIVFHQDGEIGDNFIMIRRRRTESVDSPNDAYYELAIFIDFSESTMRTIADNIYHEIDNSNIYL